MPPTTHPPHERTALGRLATWAIGHKKTVLIAWLAVLAAAIGLASAAGGKLSADYTTPGSESKAAAELLDERFGRTADTVDVVWQAPQGARATDAATARPVDQVLQELSLLEGMATAPAARDAEVSPDGRTAVVRIPIEGRPDAVPIETGERIRELAESSTVTMAVAGGFVPGIEEEPEVSSEVVGLGVAVVVLLLTFGTLVAAGLPIAIALFGLGISATLTGVIAAVVDVPDWAPQVGAMVGLGVGIDYALLVLTRWRAARAQGATPHGATVEAMATAGHSVLVAGGTVVVSMLGLFLVGLPYLHGVALVAMLSVLVVVAAALTLLPALLGLLGARVDALRIPGASKVRADVSDTPAARWARGVQRRPVLATVLASLLLVGLALPATGMRFGFPDSGNDREGTTTRQAYDLLASGFGPGANGPLVLVGGPDAAGQPQRLAALTGELEADPGVAAVAPAQASPRGDAVLIAVTPKEGPQAQATSDLVERLREGPVEASGLDVHVGGQTAQQIDQGNATADRLPLFVGGVLALSVLLLLAAFRAPLIALKAGLLNVLSIAAAYGVVAALAEGGTLGQLVGIDTETPVAPFIPVLMFAILFGLSMDYEVFLLSRVREELTRGASASDAVVTAVARTARVITAAALIMVAVFGAFALSPEVFLKLIGIGMATAILLDATVVRMVLVPAVMQLLGDRAWWAPRRRSPQSARPSVQGATSG